MPKICLGLLLLSAARAHIVSIGLQLPFDDPISCVDAWHYLHLARSAARFVEASDWWQATGAQLRLEILPSNGSYAAWASAISFALGPPPTCSSESDPSCRVFRAGIVGPWDARSTELVQLVTRMSGMVQMSYAATDDSLTQDDYQPLDEAALQPFFRVAHTDTMLMGGLYAFIVGEAWQTVTILHAQDAHARTCAATLSDLFHAPGASEV